MSGTMSEAAEAGLFGSLVGNQDALNVRNPVTSTQEAADRSKYTIATKNELEDVRKIEADKRLIGELKDKFRDLIAESKKVLAEINMVMKRMERAVNDMHENNQYKQMYVKELEGLHEAQVERAREVSEGLEKEKQIDLMARKAKDQSEVSTALEMNRGRVGAQIDTLRADAETGTHPFGSAEAQLAALGGGGGGGASVSADARGKARHVREH